jgi:hypothetical protein
MIFQKKNMCVGRIYKIQMNMQIHLKYAMRDEIFEIDLQSK